MENRIGYVVLTAGEYKELILKANKYEEQNKMCIKVEENIFEKKVLKDLYENNTYELRNIKDLNNDDFHYNDMFMKFIKIGVTDLNYIHNQIKEMKELYKNKGKRREENE